MDFQHQGVKKEVKGPEATSGHLAPLGVLYVYSFSLGSYSSSSATLTARGFPWYCFLFEVSTENLFTSPKLEGRDGGRARKDNPAQAIPTV